MWGFNIRAFAVICAAAAILALALKGAPAQDKLENYARWPVLKSTFPSTGGNGVMIKGYDPIITGKQCVTTFMAALPSGEVYFNVVEFDAVPVQGGTLCTGGKWRSFDGKSTGTTPYRVFFKDGVFRGAPN
jgi:cytochrome c556